METYNGHVRTPADAIILFEACRIGLLPRVQRRLSEKERQSIKSGSVFVWDEREAGMRRWTDGKSWSASRVSGSFLTYREMEGKRGSSSFDKTANRDGVSGDGDSDGGPDGYRYKPDGLMKQSFSITTSSGQHLHLISYFSRSASAQNLTQPTADSQLRHIRPEKGMYPESTVHEQSTIPAVTRGPMNSPAYTHSPQQPIAYVRAPSSYGHSTPGWAPPSPMHTPPLHSHYPPYYQQPPQSSYVGQAPPPNMHYPPPPPPPPPLHQAPYGHGAPMTAYDRPPAPMGNSGLPPPPPHAHTHPGYPSQYGHSNGYAYQAPPVQAPQYAPPYYQYYDGRPSPHDGRLDDPHGMNRGDRQDSHHSVAAQRGQTSAPTSQYGDYDKPAPGAAAPPAATGQTIPSISAMLNNDEGSPRPRPTDERSPRGNAAAAAARSLQDIPSHKLGFEANRDMQALRNLDKSTFKY